MLKLRKWLLDNGLAIRDLADALNVNRSYMRAMISKSAPMSVRLASIIEEFTKGEVKVEDLREDKKG